MSAQGSSQSSTGDTPTHLDDQQSRALVAFLNGRVGPGETPAHREVVNGRYVVFLAFREQTYCLMPLAFSVPEGVP